MSMWDESVLSLDPEELRKEKRKLWVGAITISTMLLVIFQIYTAGAGPFLALVQRSVHICFCVIICHLVYRMKQQGAQSRLLKLLDVIEITATIGITIYIISNIDRIVYNYGFSDPNTTDIFCGYIMIFTILNACRKAVGWVFTVIGVGFLVYPIIGPYLPGFLVTAGYPVNDIIGIMFINPQGIYGRVTGTSANMIAIYIIFGSIMLRTGAAKAFVNLSMVVAGRFIGGGAQVGVLASALMGMLNGSPTANVATVGAFTIPLMIRRGYPPAFAAGVESAASTGGQIMPPIMGAGVFIMAEILGIPYIEIATRAAIPAALYFLAIMMIVYFEARKRNLPAIPKSEIPPLNSYRSELIMLLVPTFVLVFMIFDRFTPRLAAFWAIMLNIALFIVLAKTPEAALNQYSFRKNIHFSGKSLMDAVVESGVSVATLGVLCAGAQIMTAGLGITGLGLRLSQFVASFQFEALAPYLIGAMLICLLLGMALPTVPSYLITAAVAAPILQGFGLKPLAIHLFIFYYAIMSGLTPPVLGPVYAACVFAGSKLWETAWMSMKLALVGFLIPYIFVVNPEMLGYQGFSMSLVYLGIGSIGTLLLSGGIAAYFIAPLNLLQRLALCIAGILIIVPQIEFWFTGGIVAIAAIVGGKFLGKRTSSITNVN